MLIDLYYLTFTCSARQISYCSGQPCAWASILADRSLAGGTTNISWQPKWANFASRPQVRKSNIRLKDKWGEYGCVINRNENSDPTRVHGNAMRRAEAC